LTLGSIQTAAAALDPMPRQPEQSMETLARLCAEHR
jgi:hypothetical protein